LCMGTKMSAKSKNVNNAYFILTYLLSFLSGIAVLVLYGDTNSRLKLHALQAILLGIISVVVAAIFNLLLPPLGSISGLLIWVYGMYIGLEAYSGNDIDIPIVSEFAHSLA